MKYRPNTVPTQSGGQPSPLPEKWQKIKDRLDQSENFPLKYCFKFILRAEHLDELLSLFENLEIRESKNGTYKSCSLHLLVEDSEAVIAVYRRVEHIPGIITL